MTGTITPLRQRAAERAEAISEDAIALRFSEAFAADLRYVHVFGKWFVFGRSHWTGDATLLTQDLARDLCRESAEGVTGHAASRLLSKAFSSAVEGLARADRRHAASPEQFDADGWLLNTPEGTIDLRTGNQRLHDRADLITKCAAASPGGACPTWLQFLDRVTGGNAELAAFLQRMAGYCLTGSTREHALFFLYGTGANGKSVFLNTLAGILADYATTAPMETFTVSKNERHPTDMAMLMGARLVISTETEEGERWAEAKIKALTGGDTITARFMRQDFFTFTPCFKLLIAGNHRPGIRNADEGMRRRLNLIPFTITIPEEERDAHLPEKLRAEWPGILSWMVQGCLEWQRDGLNPPELVRAATADYLTGEDAIERWISDRCVTGGSYSSTSKDLWESWRAWAKDMGESEGTQKRLIQRLKDRHDMAVKDFRDTKGRRSLAGIQAIRDDADDGWHPD